jgi:microcystin-dependent protein
MSQPYIGEIRIFAGNFAPAGWMLCEGQILPISQYETLFNLIGTTYGGDGQSTFALPDLRGRIPIHQGSGFTLAETGGVETVTLTVAQLPDHSHVALCDNGNGGTQLSPVNGVWSFDTSGQFGNYAATTTTTQGAIDTMNAGAITSTGGSQPHDNHQPFLAVNFIISLFGIFPSQT